MFLVSAAAIGVFTITAISAIVTGPVKIEQYLDWPKPGTITCVRYRSPHVYNRDPEKLFRPEVGKTGMMKATNTLHSPGYANGAATKCVKKIDHEACDGVIDCRAAPGCEKLIVRYNQIVSAKMQGTTQEKTYSYFYVGASTKIHFSITDFPCWITGNEPPAFGSKMVEQDGNVTFEATATI